MSLITPEWKVVLTNHVNRKYNTSLKPTDLTFRLSNYYAPVAGHRIIEVLPAGNTLLGRAVLVLKPYDAQSYFKNIPIVLYPDHDLTGADLVDLIGSEWGIQFDKSLDIDPTFLAETIVLGTNQQTVVIPFSSTSLVWGGTLTILLGDRGLNLPTAVINRQLNALITPDITTDNTQSLQLLTAPMILTDPVLVRKFSGTDPVTMEGVLLDRLMAEIQAQYIVQASDLNELRDVMEGQSFLSYQTNTSPYDRYAAPVNSLKSLKFSGIPRFQFTSVVIDTDVGSVAGDIIVADLTSLDNMAIFATAMGNYRDSYLRQVLERQAVLYPARATGIQSLVDDLATNASGVFESVTRPKLSDIDVDGIGKLGFNCYQNEEWSGILSVSFPIPKFLLELENGDAFELESVTAANIQLEDKIIGIYSQSGSLVPTDTSFLDICSAEEAALLGMMLFDYSPSNVFMLKTDVVITDNGNGKNYTHPDWPGITIRVNPISA